ncbi:HEAT repeat domain-containing protein [Stieleria varia]|uniref:HEAT repeat protein n=1 Tax=Stieleria varia TaxID=2528005 RepID=A0A5C5ZYH8_9BACT|nr:hypothetical protein [Stieleria varia]TWT92007.1 HEAT repeat protein [Stieleria varia]
MATDPSRLMRFLISLTTITSRASVLRCTVTLLTAGWIICGAGDITHLSAADPFARYEMQMYHRPELPTQQQRERFPEGIVELWAKALQRPDPQLQRMMVDQIADAYRRGMPGLESFIPTMVELAEKPDQSLDVVRAVAQTLITMEAKDHTDRLARWAVRYGLPIGKHVEPVLAQWQSTAMREQWIARINQSANNDSELLLAINGAGAIGLDSVVNQLTQWVIDESQSPSIRMAAARALASIDHEGVAATAGQILQGTRQNPMLDEILAVELLRKQTDKQLIPLLSRLADSKTSAVQAGALQILIAIDPELIDPYVDSAILSPDVNLRWVCVQGIAQAPQSNRMVQLARLLDDLNPTLRRDVASLLVQLADDEILSDEIIAGTKAVLNENSWRGCEQACVVMANLDHKAAGVRIVELLPHPRGEVRVASAWALSQLGVETLMPDMVEHGEEVLQKFKDGTFTNLMPGYVEQMAHLFIAFGKQGYRPARGLMSKYMPKDYSLGTHARAAACWALGMIYEGELDKDLVKTMEDQLLDSESMFPEEVPVRRMAAIGLGRMNAESAIPSLRKYLKGYGEVPLGCHWALNKMLGEPIPTIPDSIVEIDGWILSPAK